MSLRFLFICMLMTFFGPFNSVAIAQPELEKVRMQLRWHHQYQFAGYYAAKHKGYYEEAGFDVEIVAGGPDRQPVTEVLEGRADFAEGNSEVLISRLRGEPLVALASVFQHSPSVLLTLADSNINRPSDLRGKEVMLMGGESDADLIAMFLADGVKMNEVNIVPSSYNIADLTSGKTTAFNSYLTNEPYFVEQQGYRYSILSPRDYGVDFYSDILFTTEQQVKADPARVERFKQASLEGWNYAIHNSEEIIHLIYDEYNNKKTLEHMRFEALAVNALVQSDLLPIGHIFPKRFDKMVDVFIQQNMVDEQSHLGNFVFTPAEEFNNGIVKWLYLSIFIIAICFAVLSAFVKINRKLNQEIEDRQKAEEQLQTLAFTDSLTGLLNRRAFIDRYKQHEMQAKRYKHCFTLVLFDLDLFKKVNDEFGHEAGDKALIFVAETLKSIVREADIYARFGGEEFIILLANTDLSQSVSLVERIRTKLAQVPLDIDEGHSVQITASFGLVEWQGEDMNQLLKRADLAMYKAKELGRNQLYSFNSDRPL